MTGKTRENTISKCTVQITVVYVWVEQSTASYRLSEHAVHTQESSTEYAEQVTDGIYSKVHTKKVTIIEGLLLTGGLNNVLLQDNVERGE